MRNLQLQRASAGSGKTYTLARKFIELYIGYSDKNDGSLHLCSKEQLRESLRHILAVTFTVKASTEMKVRIVQKLMKLASHEDGRPYPDYMEYLCERYSASPADIKKSASMALSVLLHSYSDFNVSTIDSFFQSILRTFAYETQHNDSYNLEIESEVITAMALETLLHQMKSDTNNQVGLWMRKLMKDGALKSGWNIFEEKDRKYSLRSSLMEAVKTMYAEDYKERRDEMKKYFRENPDYYNTYCALEAHYASILDGLKKKVGRAIEECRELFRKHGIPLDVCNVDVASRFNRIEALPGWHVKDSKGEISVVPKKGCSTYIKANKKVPAEISDLLDASLKTVNDCLDEWKQSEDLRTWAIYQKPMIYLGLMAEIESASEELLRESNTVEIAETNSILARIIGDSDTPFIFERTSSNIFHYLIDEFQDTSKMQWNILRPLIDESMSQKNDNLIIGDAKQSIYRFRNAEPMLISHDVPARFEGRIDLRGISVEENTNWRSQRRVVEFNNTLFYAMARVWDDNLVAERNAIKSAIGEVSPEKQGYMREVKRTAWPVLTGNYRNVVQYPSKRKEKGYVEIRYIDKESGKKNSADDTADYPAYYAKFGQMIADFRKDKFNYSDIAILVRKNDEGAAVISALMAYNDTVDISHRINFMSEDSLKLSNARSVLITITILEGIADMYSSKGSTRKLPESDVVKIKAMLDGMSAVTLPSIVESIYSTFVPEDIRNAEAGFMTTFQDFVLSYCETQSGDVASFLQYWKKYKDKMTISSPKNADAVQIMTYHKSKGLEFPVVIVVADFGSPTKYGKKWMENRLIVNGLENPVSLPPLLPLEVNDDLAKCPEYLFEYLKAHYEDREDELNSFYVAFTRAEQRLYVFTNSDKSRFMNSMKELLSKPEKIGEITKDCDEEESASLLSLDAIEQERDGEELVFTIGIKEKKDNSSKKDDDERVEVCKMRTYNSRMSTAKVVCCRSEDENHIQVSSGKHSVSDYVHGLLATVLDASDLERELLRMDVAGVLEPDVFENVASAVRMLVITSEYKSLFDTDNYRVLTSGRLPKMGAYGFVPDRMCIDSDGNALIAMFRVDGEEVDEKKLNRYLFDVRKSEEIKTATAIIINLELNLNIN